MYISPMKYLLISLEHNVKFFEMFLSAGIDLYLTQKIE